MSRARYWGVAAVGSALFLGACSRTFLQDGPLSPQPSPSGANGLRAGFGRADITPPGGVGLAGLGPQGLRARGYRLRLYARALLLEDRAGNRLAVVVTDLPVGSALLHRRVAALTSVVDSIGLDRLVIAATHTHSGPGHYVEAAFVNDQGSMVVGYDVVLLDSLAHRVAAAVHAARLDLRDAKAAWGSRRIWGQTRIRSLPALLRDLPTPAAPPDAPDSLALEFRLIDPTLAMLRVDQRDPVTGVYRPAGAFSVFAMHGTGNAWANELLDADIHGVIERRLERHIDKDLNHQVEASFVPQAFHLFANGTEGDVSPNWPAESRCSLPVVAAWPVLAGPFTQPLWQWKPISEADRTACLRAARDAVERIGSVLGDEAIKLFDSLDGELADHLELGRAFSTLALRQDAESLGICPVPAIGAAVTAGPSDGPGQLARWKVLGLIPLNFEQGAANPHGRGCHSAKHQLLDVFAGSLFNRWFAARKIPSFAQLSVFRIGDRLIGTLPAEVTTTAGRRMREEMLAAARQSGMGVDTVLIMGLTNGHLGYVTTAEEYAAQWYEGASTVYGPGEAAMFGRALAGLTRSLSSGDVLPPASARTLTIFPGTRKHLLHPKRAAAEVPGTIERIWCSGDTLYADFRLGAVQDWVVSTERFASHARVEVLRAGLVTAWDDDPAVELQLRSLRRNPARWQLRWKGAEPGAGYAVRLEGNVLSQTVECKPAAPVR